MTTKYPNRNKAIASEINRYAVEDFATAVTLMERTNSIPKACTGYWLNLNKVDYQRSGNAVKVTGRRMVNGELGVLTGSLQCTQGGTTGELDVVTFFITVEVAGVVYHLPTVNVETVIVETNGMERIMRGVVGHLKDLTPLAISDVMNERLGRALTAPLGVPVRDQNAHRYSRDQWQHPLFNDGTIEWKNALRHIGSVGKVSRPMPKKEGRK